MRGHQESPYSWLSEPRQPPGPAASLATTLGFSAARRHSQLRQLEKEHYYRMIRAQRSTGAGKSGSRGSWSARCLLTPRIWAISTTRRSFRRVIVRSIREDAGAGGEAWHRPPSSGNSGPRALRTRWAERLVRAADPGDDSSREVEGRLSDGVRASTALTQSHPYALRYLRLPDRTIESVVTLADVRSRSIEKARRRFA